jgi:predicted alpha/beta-hydrolase family hydrolase
MLSWMASGQRVSASTACSLCTTVCAMVSMLLLEPALAVAQADYAREKRWADEVAPMLVVGDPVYLEQKGGHKFLAIWTPNVKAAAGVIVVHGVGVHPDWGLISTLRSRLADEGYATLSVQMPVLAADAAGNQYPQVFPDASERLGIALAFVRTKGLKRVAIVSHSMGSRMTNYFLNHTAHPGVDAWVAIGLSGEFTDPGGFKVPVLDLYGEKDLRAVLGAAAQRAAAIRRIRGSGQVQIAGADHFFAGREQELVNQVKLFLDARLKGH